MAAEYPNISKGPISPPDVWIQKNTCCVTQWSWSLCHDPKKYVTQRDHGFSVGGRGWFKNRLEGLSRWKNWMHFLSTFVQLPKKKIPLPFNWLVLSDDLNEQKRPFSPIIQGPKWATGYGLSTFPRKNGTLSSRFSPGFFGFCQGKLLRHLEWNLSIQVSRRRWRLQKKVVSNGWIFTREKPRTPKKRTRNKT